MKRKPNILLYIETSGIGGAEIVLLNIAKNIDRSHFNPIAILHRSGSLHEKLLEHNIDTKIIPSQRTWDIAFLLKFVKTCRQLKIDLIHSHLPGANLYSCLAGTMLRIPVIATFHNDLSMPGTSVRYAPLKNFLIRNLATKIVLIAEYMKEGYINKAKFSSRKILTIYNGIELSNKGVDFNISALRKGLGIQNDELVVGNVANIQPRKGQRYLIEAAGQICKDFPKVKFLLIGKVLDGKLKEELEEQIARLKLRSSVKLLGFRDDVQKLLRLIDIFVLPSISEGLPVSVSEAMAASKAVVATKVDGLPEIVVPEQTGYLVEPKNPAALAEKLLILLQNKNLRGQMGKMGEKVVEEKFCIKKMTENYQNLYKEFIS